MSLRISGLERIIKCPASVRAQADFEDNSTNMYARYGTHGHLCMEYSVKNRKPTIMPHPDFVDNSEFDLVGDVEKFWRILEEIVNNHGGWEAAGDVQTERSIMLKLSNPNNLDDPYFLVPGTCDLTIHFPDEELLVVVDYKFGKGYVPAAHNNLQLGGYGLGAFQSRDESLRAKWLEVNLVSLGAGHSSYKYDRGELVDLQELLYNGAKAAMDEDAKFSVGPHCKYCKAFMTTACQMSQKVPAAIEKYGLTPAKLTIETACKVRDMKEALYQGIKASEELIRHSLECGIQMPGEKYYLGTPIKRRKITDHEGFIEAAKASGVKLKTEVKTNWTDIEKQIRKKRNVTAKEAKEIIQTELGEYFTLNPSQRPLKRA